MSQFTNILTCSCPKCGQSKIFKFPFYNIAKFTSMNDKCGLCQHNFHPEPGYYLGAMYISYFISSILLLLVSLVMLVFMDFSIESTLFMLIFLSIVTLPIILRYSRVIWLVLNKDV